MKYQTHYLKKSAKKLLKKVDELLEEPKAFRLFEFIKILSNYKIKIDPRMIDEVKDEKVFESRVLIGDFPEIKELVNSPMVYQQIDFDYPIHKVKWPINEKQDPFELDILKSKIILDYTKIERKKLKLQKKIKKTKLNNNNLTLLYKNDLLNEMFKNFIHKKTFKKILFVNSNDLCYSIFNKNKNNLNFIKSTEFKYILKNNYNLTNN